MKIDEIPEDSILMLEISKDKRKALVDAEIYKIVDEGLVLKPIYVDGNILNMEDSDARLSLIYEREGDRPLIWRAVAFGSFRYGSYPYTIITDKREGRSFERRKTARITMDVQGTLNNHEKITLRDISVGGVSFFAPKEVFLEIGSEVSIRFMGGYEDISITGNVVRAQELENRYVYGCSVNSNLTIEKFISQEQSRRARRFRSPRKSKRRRGL